MFKAPPAARTRYDAFRCGYSTTSRGGGHRHRSAGRPRPTGAAGVGRLPPRRRVSGVRQREHLVYRPEQRARHGGVRHQKNRPAGRVVHPSRRGVRPRHDERATGSAERPDRARERPLVARPDRDRRPRHRRRRRPRLQGPDHAGTVEPRDDARRADAGHAHRSAHVHATEVARGTTLRRGARLEVPGAERPAGHPHSGRPRVRRRAVTVTVGLSLGLP